MFSRIIRYIPKRFSLRTVLIGMTLLCVFLGAIYPRLQRMSDVRRLRAAGYYVGFAEKIPNIGDDFSDGAIAFSGWVDSWVGDGFARQVQWVGQNSDGWKKLRNLPHTELIKLVQLTRRFPGKELNFSISLESDQDYEIYQAVFGSAAIDQVVIKNIAITPDGGKLISSFPNLRTISIEHSSDEPIGLRLLHRDEPIHSLYLQYSRPPSGYVFEDFGDTFDCRNLTITCSPPTDSLIKQIGRLKSLRSLDLYCHELREDQVGFIVKHVPQLSDLRINAWGGVSGLGELRALSKLESLAIYTNICAPPLDSEGFPRLPFLTKLKYSVGNSKAIDLSIIADRCPAIKTAEIDNMMYLRTGDGVWQSGPNQ